MSLETLQCSGESLDVPLPIEPWLPPTPMPTTRSQSAGAIPLIPFLPILSVGRISHWDATWESVMPKEWFMMAPYLMLASQASHVAVIPQWTHLPLLSVCWHYGFWVPPSRVAPPRPQSDWAASARLLSLPSLLSLKALSPFNLCLFYHSLWDFQPITHTSTGRHFRFFLGRDV